MVGEMMSLEQTVLPSGKPRIAAPPGQHDDYAMALLGLVAHLHSSRPLTGRFSLVA
jgi:hypothetical protein